MKTKSVAEMERERVRLMLERDAQDAERERLRDMAVKQVENGEFANLDDTVMPPTREQLRKGEFVPYTPRGEDGTVRSVRTVRRRVTSQLVTLHGRGVLNDDLLAACKWYRDRYEAAQMKPAAAVASYGATIRGDRLYGHLPASAWAAEARADFRWARTFIPDDVSEIFDCVILHEITLADAARGARCRYKNTAAALRRAALCLFDGIASRLPINGV